MVHATALPGRSRPTLIALAPRLVARCRPFVHARTQPRRGRALRLVALISVRVAWRPGLVASVLDVSIRAGVRWLTHTSGQTMSTPRSQMTCARTATVTEPLAKHMAAHRLPHTNAQAMSSGLPSGAVVSA